MRSYLRPLLPLLLVLVAAYWVLIFTLTHVPAPVDIDLDKYDKLAHAVAYAGLAFALGGVLTVWRGYHRSIVVSVWLLALAYGAFDEYSQQFVPNRHSDVLDLAADMVGATIGLACVHLAVVAWRAYGVARPTAARATIAPAESPVEA